MPKLSLYEEFGFKDPELEQNKAQAARNIRTHMQQQNLSDAEAAEILMISQRDLDRILRGRLGKFGLQELTDLSEILAKGN